MNISLFSLSWRGIVFEHLPLPSQLNLSHIICPSNPIHSIWLCFCFCFCFYQSIHHTLCFTHQMGNMKNVHRFIYLLVWDRRCAALSSCLLVWLCVWRTDLFTKIFFPFFSLLFFSLNENLFWYFVWSTHRTQHIEHKQTNEQAKCFDLLSSQNKI